MRHPLEYYVRGLCEPLQKALLTRAEAIAETSPDKSLKLYATAREHLDIAAKTDPAAMYLLGNSYADAGWGAPRLLKYTLPDHPECKRLRKLANDDSSFPDMMADFYKGNPITLYAGQYSMIMIGRKALNRDREIAPAMYALGLVALQDFSGLSKRELRHYITGLNVTTLSYYAERSKNCLLEVFELCRTSNAQDLPWIYVTLSNDHWRKNKLILMYMVGWSEAVSPWMLESSMNIVQKMSIHMTMEQCRLCNITLTNKYRYAAITWLLCAQGLCHKNVAIIIGKLVYAERFVVLV